MPDATAGAGAASDARDKPNAKDNAAYLKRREQVRRAQRTHRERKETYIKSLETEVLSLRTNESRIVQETRTLYAEIARLRKLLDQYGISHGTPSAYILPGLQQHQLQQNLQPSDLFTGLDGDVLSEISVLANPHLQLQQQLHVREPLQGGGAGSSGGGGGPSSGGLSSGVEFYLSGSEASSGAQKAVRKKRSFFRARGRSESASNENSSNSEFNQRLIGCWLARRSCGHANQHRPASGQVSSNPEIAAITASASTLHLRDMDQTSIGMEFVLTLEAPCLHHTQGESPKDSLAPTGHALTVSAPLLFQSPTQPVPTTSSAGTPPWETSHVGLEKLLSLSTNFDLTDEITPVQAWHQLRSHPDFESLQVPSLRKLTEDLRTQVKCYGFGAVIDTDKFGDLVAAVFPGGGFNFGYAL
ncbi:hypothetical protein BDV95DRAFT_374091 [Massariosphaeria phaeospora]|uniref:BZIP domain-containing protein n=1 Tax=Massariosphaeria phaeospora TaxID=100035 RepID=A0A7C8I879_9PLEO|nr:hypothetical protein BDV95DRAFT_374091 [Massariosphaeria phaeospora]